MTASPSSSGEDTAPAPPLNTQHQQPCLHFIADRRPHVAAAPFQLSPGQTLAKRVSWGQLRYEGVLPANHAPSPRLCSETPPWEPHSAHWPHTHLRRHTCPAWGMHTCAHSHADTSCMHTCVHLCVCKRPMYAHVCVPLHHMHAHPPPCIHSGSVHRHMCACTLMHPPLYAYPCIPHTQLHAAPCTHHMHSYMCWWYPRGCGGSGSLA